MDGDPIEIFPNTDGTTTNKKCPKGSSISPGGRNFNFAGQADLIDPCPSPAPPPPPPPPKATIILSAQHRRCCGRF